MTRQLPSPMMLLEILGSDEPGKSSAGNGDHVYDVRFESSRIVGCRSPVGLPALMIQLQGIPIASGRVTGGVSLFPLRRVAFDVEGREWTSDVAVLTCCEAGLAETWAVLAVDVAREIQDATADPTWKSIRAALRRWERLLKARRSLSREEELGLWGELTFIIRSGDIQRSVSSWCGPFGAAVDFYSGSQGVECKATTTRLSHHVSLQQAQRPVGDHDAYLVSMWVREDPADGTTVPQLVEEIIARLADETDFVRKLLEAGYSPADAAQYVRPYSLLNPPQWFDVEAVPRVRQVDPGVSQVRYRVQLDEDDALADDRVGLIRAQFLGSAKDSG